MKRVQRRCHDLAPDYDEEYVEYYNSDNREVMDKMDKVPIRCRNGEYREYYLTFRPNEDSAHTPRGESGRSCSDLSLGSMRADAVARAQCCCINAQPADMPYKLYSIAYTLRLPMREGVIDPSFSPTDMLYQSIYTT